MIEYYFLGECVELNSPKGKFKLSDFLLLAYVDGNHLLILPKDQASQTHERPSPRIQQSYFAFQGREFRNTISVDFPEDEFDLFAKATSVLYRSDKRHGGGDGNPNLFRHQFGATCWLWKTPSNDAFLVGGKNLEVTSRGIVH